MPIEIEYRLEADVFDSRDGKLFDTNDLVKRNRGAPTSNLDQQVLGSPGGLQSGCIHRRTGFLLLLGERNAGADRDRSRVEDQREIPASQHRGAGEDCNSPEGRVERLDDDFLEVLQSIDHQAEASSICIEYRNVAFPGCVAIGDAG